MTDDPAIAALLAEARIQYVAGLAAKVADLESLITRGAWDEARRAAHKLRGSAGTYGFAEVSAPAAAIEEALIESNGAPDDAVKARVAELAREVRAQADVAAAAAKQ